MSSVFLRDIRRRPASDPRLDALRRPFDELGDILRLRASGRRVSFLRLDGNYGDGLIRCGAELFLADLGLDVDVLDMSSRVDKLRALGRAARDPYGRSRLFIVNGGGGWSDHCSTALRDVARQLRLTADLIVLPSTVETMPLRRIPTIYRRDQLGSRDVLPEAPFCHDMAFYLALLPRQRWFAEKVEIDRDRGVFFRGDNEARITHGRSLADNDDLSARGNHVSDIGWFLREIARCDHVITDRLHVAVGGLLLGRRVSLVEGRTFKIRAIFESSIAPHFDRCELVSDTEAIERATA